MVSNWKNTRWRTNDIRRPRRGATAATTRIERPRPILESAAAAAAALLSINDDDRKEKKREETQSGNDDEDDGDQNADDWDRRRHPNTRRNIADRSR